MRGVEGGTQEADVGQIGPWISKAVGRLEDQERKQDEVSEELEGGVEKGV